MSLGKILKKAGLLALGVATEAIPVGGIARDIITKTLDMDNSSADDKIIEALTPDAILKLKESEKVHERELMSLGIEKDKLDLQDRQGARNMRITTVTGGQGDLRADLMLGMAFAAVLTIAIVLAVGGVDVGSAVGGFLITIGGMFARNIGTAFDFHYGSSKSSREKDALIAKEKS